MAPLTTQTEAYRITTTKVIELLRNKSRFHYPDSSILPSKYDRTNAALEECLRRDFLAYLPEDLLSFFTQTSILERVHPDLCDTILQRQDSYLILQSLHQRHLFVSQLDNGWYQYHPLLQNILYAWLKEHQPMLITTLHQRASLWYEQHNLLLEAIKHALSASNETRARELLQKALHAFYQTYTQPQMATNVNQEEVILEKLSTREQEILRFIANGASNAEIANNLVLAVGTVKRHISNIFTKLLVNSRTQAVARARSLGLL